jgi:hypothetical protein
LFFFNDLTPFSFRANRERPLPRPTKPPPGAGEKRERGLRCILKNRSRPQPVRQENVGFFAECSDPRSGAFAAGANCQSDPFNRICMTFARDMGRTRSESRHAPVLRERFSTLDAGFDGLA